jgi:hypothetical protein
MELAILDHFFAIAAQDSRLTNLHVAVFTALFLCWHLNQFQNPVQVSRQQIMRMAKVQRTTYHKCIHDLQALGLIDYMPSYHPVLGSAVSLKTSI